MGGTLQERECGINPKTDRALSRSVAETKNTFIAQGDLRKPATLPISANRFRQHKHQMQNYQATRWQSQLKRTFTRARDIRVPSHDSNPNSAFRTPRLCPPSHLVAGARQQSGGQRSLASQSSSKLAEHGTCTCSTCQALHWC